jgi:hypothetical protein
MRTTAVSLDFSETAETAEKMSGTESVGGYRLRLSSGHRTASSRQQGGFDEN